MDEISSVFGVHPGARYDQGTISANTGSLPLTRQFALRLVDLIVESPKSSPDGMAMVVLDEASGQTERGEALLVPTLQKEPTSISMNSGFQKEHVVDFGWPDLHGG